MTWFFVLFSRSCCLKNKKKKKKKGKNNPTPTPKQQQNTPNQPNKKKPLNLPTLQSPPESIASYDESFCGSEWELVYFFFLLW